MSENIKVSIITPVYKGNKYLKKLLKNICEALKFDKSLKFEWILVNDFPSEKLINLNSLNTNLIIRMISNSKNLGIQASRVNGLKIAKGEYVLFLDQDDLLTKDAIQLHLKNISDYDVSVGNGYLEDIQKEYRKIFKNINQINYVKNISTYFFIGNIIISPGMVLIKRKKIPTYWQKRTLKYNGADDWLLWVMLLADNAKFTTFDSITYIHRYTAENTSDNVTGMIKSSEEALQSFIGIYPEYKKIAPVYIKRLTIWHNISLEKKNKFIQYLVHPSIGLRFFIYKVR